MDTDEQNAHLETLSEIRSLMVRSSRFISLSGLSGVFIGIFALAGVGAAYIYFNIPFHSGDIYQCAADSTGNINPDFYHFFIIDAFCVLTLSLIVGCSLTIRKAKLNNTPIWDSTSKRLLINLAIPLLTGGFFCLVLLNRGQLELIAPATLVFYGLTLLNASKYTLDDIRYLGILEIVLGLLASVYVKHGLLFWAAGFGILHIIYGTIMYYKYER